MRVLRLRHLKLNDVDTDAFALQSRNAAAEFAESAAAPGDQDRLAVRSVRRQERDDVGVFRDGYPVSGIATPISRVLASATPRDPM